MKQRTINKILRWFGKVPSWKKCRLASCWDGPNALRRMMNILSANMSDEKFKRYVRWMEEQGCDTVHCILINKADGENAGYNCATVEGHARVARERIKYLRKRGFAYVPWIICDDSADYATDLFLHADARLKALSDAGLFEEASYVVLGLEMDEPKSYPGAPEGWPKVRAALKAVCKRKVGVHHCSGNSFRYAHLGDIILGQLDPKKATESAIRNQIAIIRGKGKAAVGFEYERHADRQKATWALDAGAVGVGNW